MFAVSSVQNSSYINLSFKLLYFLVLTFSEKRCVKHELCANANNVIKQIQLIRGGGMEILVNITILIANFNATSKKKSLQKLTNS